MKGVIYILVFSIYSSVLGQNITINDPNAIRNLSINHSGKPGVSIPPKPEIPPGNVYTTPNDYEGTIDQRIEAGLAYIAANNGGTLELGLNEVNGTRIWNITKAIRPRSNTTIYINDSRLKMANGVFDNMIRNYGISVNPSDTNGMALALNENVNIKIIGNGPTRSFIEGSHVAYSAPHPINGGSPVYWVGDWYGWRTITLLFANVKGFEVSGIAFSRVKGWTTSFEHGCEDGLISNLKFNSTVKNGDGVNIRKGCSNITIEDISGSTYDDMVACTALLFENNTYPNGDYIWPWQVGGWASSALGNNISGIVINNITGSSRTHMVICLATGGGKVQNITGTNIIDDGYFSAIGVVTVYTSPGYGTPAVLGDITDLNFTNVYSIKGTYALEINAPTVNCSFDTIENDKVGGIAYQLQPTYAGQQTNLSVTNVIP